MRTEFAARLAAANTTVNSDSLLVQAVVDAHGPLDLDCLVSACLTCGSIAAAPDRESRDNIVKFYDTTCHTGSTVHFTTTLASAPTL